jgi:hypothetical protein
MPCTSVAFRAPGVVSVGRRGPHMRAILPRPPLLLIGVAASTVLVGAPVLGWPPVVRLPAILVPAVLLAALVVCPWRASVAEWQSVTRWVPSDRIVWTSASIAAAALFWIVLTRFQSGEINAVDFTVYFDRPCFQTLHGRPLFIETADFRQSSWQSALQHHAYWGMFAVCGLYAIYATPVWLLALSVVAVIFGAVYVLRIMQHLRAPGIVAAATALAFVLNDNTARTLNYGFHPEVLFAWSIPWLLYAGLQGKRTQFAAAAFATILVKESAILHLSAASVALALVGMPGRSRPERVLWLVTPVSLALANLGVYYALVVPTFPAGGPAYAHFWASYGPTPILALAGMAADPLRVLGDTVRSGFFSRVLPPHAFLPIVGWRWTIGIAPIVALFSASDDDQLRAFGIYYSIALVPFLVIGASTGALLLARLIVDDYRAAGLTATLLLSAAVLVGSGDRGYSLRPWRSEVAGVGRALSLLRDERVVLVQSGLYPHAGYEERVKLLTAWMLLAPEYRDAAVLIAPGIGAYPLQEEDIARLARQPTVAAMPDGLRAVRALGGRRDEQHRYN